MPITLTQEGLQETVGTVHPQDVYQSDEYTSDHTPLTEEDKQEALRIATVFGF